VAGQIGFDKSVDRMATLMGKEHSSLAPGQLYPDYYRDAYEKIVDVDEEPPTPPRRP
jgi:hypothetical protein